MSNQLTNWLDLKQQMTSLSQAEIDKIDLKVQIDGEVLIARQEEKLIQ
ncbi:MAG: hypothetical protein LBM60_09400 [Clostridium sp.]|jgi:hypothetical protein|nr:hypothetical protein [Clostridium sp.]